MFLTLEPDAIRTATGELTFRTQALIDGAFVDAIVDRAVAAAHRAADSGVWSPGRTAWPSWSGSRSGSSVR